MAFRFTQNILGVAFTTWKQYCFEKMAEAVHNATPAAATPAAAAPAEVGDGNDGSHEKLLAMLQRLQASVDTCQESVLECKGSVQTCSTDIAALSQRFALLEREASVLPAAMQLMTPTRETSRGCEEGKGDDAEKSVTVLPLQLQHRAHLASASMSPRVSAELGFA